MDERKQIEARLAILRAESEPDMVEIRELTQRLTDLPGSESLDVSLVRVNRRKYKAVKV